MNDLNTRLDSVFGDNANLDADAIGRLGRAFRRHARWLGGGDPDVADDLLSLFAIEYLEMKSQERDLSEDSVRKAMDRVASRLFREAKGWRGRASSLPTEPEDRGSQPPEVAQWAETGQQLRLALLHLKPNELEVVYHRLILGESLDECARLVGVSPRTAYAWLGEARVKLALILGKAKE